MSSTREQLGAIDRRFSSPDATAMDWKSAETELQGAEVFWLTTVRADGRPHVAPLLAVYDDGAIHFCTGYDEQKAMNLAHDARCAITTGCNVFASGTDVIVEGTAIRVDDEAALMRLADSWIAKYGSDWQFAVSDGAFLNQEGGRALVYRIDATKVLAFGRGPSFSQTTWRL